MNKQIDLRHFPFTGEWQAIGYIDQAVIQEIISPTESREIVPQEELGQFFKAPIVIFEMQ